AGRRLGAYTLVRELGAGGMGSVWLGRRDDGRFDGEVAIKLPNLALLSRGGAERFAREGRLLARLAHPHIARLLDAGVADSQPYLVLEYVDGAPIDRWCDAQSLDIRARLSLFLDVLAAVAHAHSHLVLHRDLKPSNILVDRAGRVKLLDFGVAKLLGDSGPAAATELTLQAGRAFTPEYAAPEQVRGEPVTTATDVYALGVLLYVLLGGRHPTAQATDAPLDRLRATLETEPATLSQAVAQTAGASARAAATARATTTVRLARELRGDLDNIVAKALKKPVDERYPTVEALADDLRRHLDDQPVSARPDSLGYRTAKFLRRYRLAVGAASATLLALVAGVIGTSWQAWEAQRQRDLARAERAVAEQQRARAQREEARAAQAAGEATLAAQRADEQARRAEDAAQRAEAEARRAEQARQQALAQARRADREAELARNEARRAEAVQAFLTDIFRQNRANQPDPAKARATPARELLDIAAARVDGALADAPLAKLQVLHALDDIYFHDLVLPEDALWLARARLALAREVHGERSLPTAQAMLRVASRLHRSRAEAEREPLLRQAEAIIVPLGAAAAAEQAALWREWSRFQQTRNPARAAEFAARAVALQRPRGDAAALAVDLYLLAQVQSTARRYAEAEAAYLEWLQLVERDRGSDRSAEVAMGRMYLGSTQYRLLKFDAADASFRAATEGIDRQFGVGHARALEVRRRHALQLLAAGRLDEAASLARAAVSGLRPAGERGGDALLRHYFDYALVLALQAQGDRQQATRRLADSVAEQQRGSTDRLFLAMSMQTLAQLYGDAGRWREADALLSQAEAIFDHTRLDAGDALRRDLTRQRAQVALGEAAVDRARALAERSRPPSVDLPDLDDIHELLLHAALSADLGDAEAVRTHTERAAQAIERRQAATQAPLLRARVGLLRGRLALDRGDAAAARDELTQAVDLLSARVLPISLELAEARLRLAQAVERSAPTDPAAAAALRQ
ncbi:MAG: serine/threonine protein kinase, partial [Burkholderiaceae bacterium]|nr:serine/threonine protein kinase [Burkholderiaceae bacterium]